MTIRIIYRAVYRYVMTDYVLYAWRIFISLIKNKQEASCTLYYVVLYIMLIVVNEAS